MKLLKWISPNLDISQVFKAELYYKLRQHVALNISDCNYVFQNSNQIVNN